jgi:serine/threonine protein kinase
MTLSPGVRLGPYEVLALLGKGGMGEVWRARDVRVDRTVALKVLPEEFFESEERRGRFSREAKLLASLNHPGIATLYSFEEIAGRHVLAMELVEGDDLATRISSGPLPLEEIRSFARQVAEALAAAHEKGIVHRDLKPTNVRLASGGRVKLLDFGLAKRADEPPVGSEDATATAALSEAGAVMGTVPYMSPEQVSGRPMDARSDLFSLGIVLYEMASGRRPFAGGSTAELAAAILRDTPPPVGRLRADLPEDLADVIARCLEKDPRSRVRSARDFLARGRGSASRRASRTPQPASRCGRRSSTGSSSTFSRSRTRSRPASSRPCAAVSAPNPRPSRPGGRSGTSRPTSTT